MLKLVIPMPYFEEFLLQPLLLLLLLISLLSVIVEEVGTKQKKNSQNIA